MLHKARLVVMLINLNEVVSLTQMQCSSVCGPEGCEITAQKPLICKVGTLHHPARAISEVAEATSDNDLENTLI